MSSDLVGSGIPFLEYRAYIERIFFPSHQESPLRQNLDVPESRRQTVEHGLIQLSNLLNSKLFLTKVSQHGFFDIGDGQLIQLYLLNVCHNWFSSISYFVKHFSLLFFSKFTPILAQVYSHTGAPADFLSKGSGLCCLSAHSCATW